MRHPLKLLSISLVAFSTFTEAKDEFGHAVIRAPAHGSEIVITTTPRLAGAIHSLTWNGKEFIDSFDHGRQMQSAAVSEVSAMRSRFRTTPPKGLLFTREDDDNRFQQDP